MLNFWFIHTSEVSLSEQIVTQLRLAILSGELAGGERLPSVRALARRFELHHNTVSAAYQRLQQMGLVESRRGSGVYVRQGQKSVPSRSAPEASTEQMLAALVATARGLGITERQLQAKLRETYRTQRPASSVCLLEPDPDLLQIVLTELQQVLPCAVRGVEAISGREEELPNSVVAVLPSKADATRALLPTGAPLFVLRLNSAAGSLAQYLPVPRTTLIGIASGSQQFRQVARTMLLAVGIEEDVLLIRNTHLPNWNKGLEQAAVVCDSFTARYLPPGATPLPFSLVAQDCLLDLAALTVAPPPTAGL